jgi:diguanylate cyclase (GGDEF)-like protein
MTGSSSWLCPTALDRARVVDSSERIRRARLIGAAAIGVALVASAPWEGWWLLGFLALASVNLLGLDAWMSRTEHPERPVAFSLLFTEALIAGAVAFSGAGQSPLLPWLAIPIGMAAVRFRLPVVLWGLVVGTLITLGVTLGVEPSSVLDSPVLVIATIALFVNVVAVATALQGAELKHRRESVLDPLTGLLNRKSLRDRFIELEEQAHRTDGWVCMVALDIDGFKQVNDELGHSRGDAALRDATYEMRKALRNFELFYRYGGEEFVVVLPGVGIGHGEVVAERLRLAVEHARPAGLELTISLGVAAARGADVTLASLLAESDAAMYEAKRAGRNRVVVAGDTPAKPSPERRLATA